MKIGRLLKNDTIETASSAITVPTGTAGERPTTPENGQLRYNTSDNVMEMYVNSAWVTVAKVGLVSIVKDTFTGDGSTTAYTASQSIANEQDVIVHVGNVHQNPGVAYTVSGTTITFTSPPPDTHTIIVQHGYNSTGA
jgi:hypothetical protein